MHWDSVAAIASLLSFAAVLIGGVFGYGKLTQKTADNTRLISGHGRRLDEHEVRIRENEVDIRGLKSWTDGYNAGASGRGERI